MVSTRTVVALCTAIGSIAIAGCASSPGPANLEPTWTVSGTVSGATVAGVTVRLSGKSTRTATTGADGRFAFASVVAGEYVITPSLGGYGFLPASRTLTVGGADVGAQDFTAARTFRISGTVTGAWGEGVTVQLAGGAVATTTTSATGAYAFDELYAGDYTVSASLRGYTFSPAGAAPVTVGNADVTRDFSAQSAVASCSISGAVGYDGARGGTIHVGVQDAQNCPSCSPHRGTSVGDVGGYVVRGVECGRTYTVMAWRDAAGTGRLTAYDPVATRSVTVPPGPADVTGIDLALSDPAAFVPQTPTGLRVFPGSGAAVVLWDRVQDGNGVEAATAYKVYWGTDANASNRTPVTIRPGDSEGWLQGGVSDGERYYYRIVSVVGGAESTPSPVVGPVTIGPVAAGHTLTGTVTFPGTATGPLYVGVADFGASVMRVARIASPTSPAPFTVTGIPAGASYTPFAIVDMNGDGAIDLGDLASMDSGGPGEIVAITGPTVHDLSISAGSAVSRLLTQHEITQGVASSDAYGVNLRVTQKGKRPVAVVLYSGPPGVAVPADVGSRDGTFEWSSWGPARPGAGDAYRFKVSYSDGASELLSGAVTAVLDAFATSLAAATTSPASPGAPRFTWVPPAEPPAGATCRVELWGPGASWWYPDGGGLPIGTTSVLYDADGRATPATLVAGTTYTWSVRIADANENVAAVKASYSY